MIEESRKIVKSGNTSFTIALPIDWIRKNNLSKGSDIKIIENQAGDLLIFSDSKIIDRRTDILTIKIDEKDISSIDFEIAQGYIQDYQTIIIEGNDLKKKLNHILSRIDDYIGLDVIEQGTHYLTIKNFFHLDAETSPRLLIRKMSMGTMTFFDLSDRFFKEGLTKADILESQILMEQNEKLFNLIRKSVLKVFENPQLMKVIQTTPLDLLKDRIVALNLKNISGLLHTFVKTLLFIERKKKETELLKEVVATLKEEYMQVVNAINTGRYDALKEFIRKNGMDSHNSRLREINHHLVVESIYNLKMCKSLLLDIAHQALE